MNANVAHPTLEASASTQVFLLPLDFRIFSSDGHFHNVSNDRRRRRCFTRLAKTRRDRNVKICHGKPHFSLFARREFDKWLLSTPAVHDGIFHLTKARPHALLYRTTNERQYNLHTCHPTLPTQLHSPFPCCGRLSHHRPHALLRNPPIPPLPSECSLTAAALTVVIM